MAEAAYVQDGCIVKHTLAAAVVAGEVIHLPDGRAGVAVDAYAAGAQGEFIVRGIVEVAKTLTMVMLKSSGLYWDASAGKAHLLHGNSTDFFLGTVTETAASAATTVKVNLNVKPVYTLSLADGYVSKPIPAITANPQGMMLGFGNGVNMVFDTAAEAEKFDALSIRGVAVGTPGILHALVCVNVNGDAAAFDFNVGLANDTHATDADSITESLFFHTDGGALVINAGSDDGTTANAAATTGVSFVVGTPFLVQADLTDDEDIQLYVNGVNVIPATAFKLNAATGPLKLLAHMEKTADDSPGNVTVMDLGFTAFDL